MKLVALAFSDAALDYLETIPHKLRAQVIKKAKALILDPLPQGSKKLKDKRTVVGEPVFRIRSGCYRVLYIVRNAPSEVVILDIGHRKDVYR